MTDRTDFFVYDILNSVVVGSAADGAHRRTKVQNQQAESPKPPTVAAHALTEVQLFVFVQLNSNSFIGVIFILKIGGVYRLFHTCHMCSV